jgi:dynein heavy chain
MFRRWARDIEILNSKYDLLAGDSLVSAGMVAYSGPFTSSFRTDLQAVWIE